MPTERAQEIEVISDAGNTAVVRMPGRRFPGLVIQGDSLFAFYNDVREIEADLNTSHGEDSDLVGLVRALADNIHERLWLYEHDLKQAGYEELPYGRSVGQPGGSDSGHKVV